MLSKLFHATHGTAFAFSECLEFCRRATEIKNKVIRGTIGIFRGTPKISVTANTIKLPILALVACRESLEAEGIRTIPLLEPAACGLERVARTLGRRTARNLDESVKILASREAPAFRAHTLSLNPCVKAPHLFAIAFRAIGAIGAIGTIHTGQYKIQVLRHPRLRTYLHDAVTLAVARIREGFRTGRKQEQ